MKNTWARKFMACLGTTLLGFQILHTGCMTNIKIPGGKVQVDQEGVFVRFLGILVDVTDDHVLVDVPGVEVNVHD